MVLYTYNFIFLVLYMYNFAFFVFIHYLYTIYSLFIHCLYTMCTLLIYHLYPIYLLFIYLLYTVHTPFIRVAQFLFDARSVCTISFWFCRSLLKCMAQFFKLLCVSFFASTLHELHISVSLAFGRLKKVSRN